MFLASGTEKHWEMTLDRLYDQSSVGPDPQLAEGRLNPDLMNNRKKVTKAQAPLNIMSELRQILQMSPSQGLK